MIIEDKSPQKGRKMDKSKIPHAGIVAIILVGFIGIFAYIINPLVRTTRQEYAPDSATIGIELGDNVTVETIGDYRSEDYMISEEEMIANMFHRADPRYESFDPEVLVLLCAEAQMNGFEIMPDEPMWDESDELSEELYSSRLHYLKTAAKARVKNNNLVALKYYFEILKFYEVPGEATTTVSSIPEAQEDTRIVCPASSEPQHTMPPDELPPQ